MTSPPSSGSESILESSDNLQERWVAFLLVMGAVVVQARQIWPALYIPWWFNTDEIFYFSEVARFLGGDFNQTYFDIPGTPLMLITTVVMWIGWALSHVLGFTLYANPQDFALANLQGMATLMRLETLGLSVLAVLVSFFAIRRAANVFVAAGVGILVITLPIFIQYSQFVRSESLGLVMCFGAWLLVQRADPKRRGHAYLWAGVMCGVAMAARFHYALVGPPLLLVHWLVSTDFESRSDHPAWAVKIWVGLLYFFIVGAVWVLLVRFGVFDPSFVSDAQLVTSRNAAGERLPAGLAPDDVIKATGTISKLWYFLAIGAVALLTSRHLLSHRPLANRAFHPWACAALVGFSIGFLLSHPAFLWQGYHQLRSISFYSAWDDADLAQMSLPAAWWKVTSYYFMASLPEWWLQLLCGLGLGWILYRRHPGYWPLFALVAVCFLAHPPRMKLWPHHIIPWLPALCAVALLPVGELWDRFSMRRRHWCVGGGLIVLSLGTLLLLLRPRITQASSYYEISRDRIEFITSMENWLRKAVRKDDALLISYYSMNSDCFYLWLQSRGIAIPDFIERNRQAEVWWLKKKALEGRKGYVAVSPADISFFYADFERKEPGQNVNPLTDNRFVEKAAFGAGFYEIKVFSFDFSRTQP